MRKEGDKDGKKEKPVWMSQIKRFDFIMQMHVSKCPSDFNKFKSGQIVNDYLMLFVIESIVTRIEEIP